MGRLVHALEGLVVAGLVAAVFFLIALAVRLVTGKKIGSKRYYGAAIAGGFILYGALISVSTTMQGGARITHGARGLDAAFLAPDDAHLEQFPVQLEQAMEQLPEPQREAFLLQQESDMSIEEIAAATGVGPETAKSRLRYAVAKLRASLGKES